MFFDATQEPVPVTSKVRPLPEGGFEARAVEVTSIDGDLILDVQPSDFSAADIMPGAWFELVARKQSFRLLFGRDAAAVKRGAWVAFPNADGFCTVARNHENAAVTAGLDAGDAVIIRRLSEDAASTFPPPDTQDASGGAGLRPASGDGAVEDRPSGTGAAEEPDNAK